MKRSVQTLILVLMLAALLPGTACAQDFYGEGNVLIAVDMAPYGENDAIDDPEGTMGTLVWGADAPTGESTRPAFRNQPYTVPDDVASVPAPDYDLETAYTVGQTVFFPFIRFDDPDQYGASYTLSTRK